MLVHQIWISDGSANDTVVLKDRTVFNSSSIDTVHSGIVFNLSGQLFTIQTFGGTSQVDGEWLVSGTAANFFVQRTIISGTLESDPGGGFLQLNATRTYENLKSSVGQKTTVVFFEISSDVSGIPVVATATMTFVSDRETP